MSLCFCIDYKRLNTETVQDAYPLLDIEEALGHLSGHAQFFTLDFNSGYLLVAIEEEDKSKTAFVTRKGLFQFKMMLFGLTCAPATFKSSGGSTVGYVPVLSRRYRYCQIKRFEV